MHPPLLPRHVQGLYIPAGLAGLIRTLSGPRKDLPMEAFEKWSHPEDAAGTGAGPDRPVLLSWTDPSSGEELWVEMWGGAGFVSELLGLGFGERCTEGADADVGALGCDGDGDGIQWALDEHGH